MEGLESNLAQDWVHHDEEAHGCDAHSLVLNLGDHVLLGIATYRDAYANELSLL